MIYRGLLKSLAPVIASIVHINHFKLRFEQFNGRQNAVAVKTVRIQPVRVKVRCGDKPYAVMKQRRQQAMKNHRVGNIRHMKLVKADQFITFCHARGQLVKRISSASQILQFAVNFAHELVKMQSNLSPEWHHTEKTIH